MKPIIPVMRTALEQIQELHPIEETGVEYHGVKEVWCPTCRDYAPCETRKLADAGLADRMARTNQGENNE